MKVEVVMRARERPIGEAGPAGAARDAWRRRVRVGWKQAFGIFGKRTALDHPLSEGDRVEIYRALAMDPKEARRLRARKKP
jgi:putative ubiquitin-RnfH superfamily antitoxin RatB of RatAB toxin-antitoxin module